jgi:hypothetical protein
MVVGDRAYLAVVGGYLNGSIKLVDLRDPARPATIGSVDLRALPGRLARHLNYVYVSEQFEGPVRPGILEVVDFGDPALPKVSATLDLEGDPAVVDGHLVLAGSRGVQTFDLTSPIAPRRIGSLDLAVSSSLVVDHMLYATVGAERVEALAVVDLSDLAAPRLVGRLPGWFPTVQARLGSRLLLGWYDSGVQVIDVSDPAAPRALPAAGWQGDQGFFSVVWDLAAAGDRVYVCSGEGGLHILQLTDLPLTATPTPSASPSPAPTRTATPHPTASPVHTVTPLPSPSAARAAVFLPISGRDG